MPPDLSLRFLERHLNVTWLRPENVLWDAIASAAVAKFEFRQPSLDLGCGNGTFSFLTAGGEFTFEYDWYRNVAAPNPETEDLFDAFNQGPSSFVARRPSHGLDWGLDTKPNLLLQARDLGFYGAVMLADANEHLPFQNNSFRTVFSNILYWLDSPEGSLREIHRILEPGGQALLCLPDDSFPDACPSYAWQTLHSETLRRLNAGRRDVMRWTVSDQTIESLARGCGFRIAGHERYLSPLTLKVWDVGLRPIAPLLFNMLQRLGERDRQEIKAAWIDTLRPYCQELLELELQDRSAGCFHLVAFEKLR